MHFIKNAPQWKAAANQKKIEDPIAPIESESKSIEQGNVQSLGDRLRERSEKRRRDAIARNDLPQLDAPEKQRLVDELEGMITKKLLQSTNEFTKCEVLFFPISTSNREAEISFSNVGHWMPFFENLASRMKIKARLAPLGINFYWD